MIFFDSMAVSGLRWVLSAIQNAAMAEMNDVTALRAALVEAGALLQSGEIDEEEYAQAEEELLARIREIRARNEPDAGPIAFGESTSGAAGAPMEVEASVVGDFHEALPAAEADAPDVRRRAKRPR
jgi:hypothetical protein